MGRADIGFNYVMLKNDLQHEHNPAVELQPHDIESLKDYCHQA